MPIGNREVNYLKIYVVSPLSEGDKTIGAAVKYAAAVPETYKLPEYGSTVLRIDRFQLRPSRAEGVAVAAGR